VLNYKNVSSKFANVNCYYGFLLVFNILCWSIHNKTLFKRTS
jgi:hypothetical protein